MRTIAPVLLPFYSVSVRNTHTLRSARLWVAYFENPDTAGAYRMDMNRRDNHSATPPKKIFLPAVQFPLVPGNT